MVRIIELGGLIIAIIFLVTQVIVPLVREEAVFPFLRTKSSREKIDADFRAMTRRVEDLEHTMTKQAELEARLASLEAKKTKTKDAGDLG